jgi:hypothetical protein
MFAVSRGRAVDAVENGGHFEDLGSALEEVSIEYLGTVSQVEHRNTPNALIL